jgi:hypothetical protein
MGSSVDVFVGAPLGNNGNYIYAPGLNQMVISYDSSRTNVQFWIATAAVADSKARLFYVGCGRDNIMETTIAETFTSYSNADNPMTYRLTMPGWTDETLPTLTIDISHVHSPQNHYITTQWYCDHASSSLIDTWNVDDGVVESFGNWIVDSVGSLFTSMDSTTLQIRYYSLFAVKAVQIYDLCHCYNHDNSKLVPCLGESSPEWVDIALRVVRDGLSWIKIDIASWNSIPQVMIRGQGWKQCVANWHSNKHHRLVQKDASSETNGMQDSDFVSDEDDEDMRSDLVSEDEQSEDDMQP